MQTARDVLYVILDSESACALIQPTLVESCMLNGAFMGHRACGQLISDICIVIKSHCTLQIYSLSTTFNLSIQVNLCLLLVGYQCDACNAHGVINTAYASAK